MPDMRALRPALPILIGASVMLSLSMGLRQSLGIFMPPLTKDVGISVSDFTLAIAVQNLVWGFLQPLAGAWAVRLGFRRLMVVGSLLYVAGLMLLATAHGLSVCFWARAWPSARRWPHRRRVRDGGGVASGLGGAAKFGTRHRLRRRFVGRADGGAARPGAGAAVGLARWGCTASSRWRC